MHAIATQRNRDASTTQSVRKRTRKQSNCEHNALASQAQRNQNAIDLQAHRNRISTTQCNRTRNRIASATQAYSDGNVTAVLMRAITSQRNRNANITLSHRAESQRNRFASAMQSHEHNTMQKHA
jgi:hypothetical protein